MYYNILSVLLLLRKDEKIAVMQPTYLPWYGYFGLIDYVDEFIS